MQLDTEWQGIRALSSSATLRNAVFNAPVKERNTIMMVNAKTEYTKETLLTFAQFNARKQPAQIVVYVVLELLLAFISSLLMLMSGTTAELIISIVLAPIFLLVVPATILITPRFVAKMSKGMIGAVNTYEFSDDGIVIESTLPMAAGQTKAGYNYFESIYETKDAFYLFISKQQAFIMNKSDITEESISDLQELFTKNIPPSKYITKKPRFKLIPLLIIPIVAALVFVAVYSFSNLPVYNSDDKVFSQSGLTITLTDKFYERDMVPFTAVFGSSDLIIFALKEEFVLFENQNLSLKEYAEFVIAANQTDTTVKVVEGLTSFTFEDHVNGKDYVYFATVYKGDDAYWLLQFACETTKYESLRPAIIQYAKSVTVVATGYF